MALEDRIRKKVVAIVAATFKVDEARLTPETNLDEELGATSLNYVSLQVDMEEEFEVMVPFNELRADPTVGGITRLIIKLRKG